MLHMALFGQSHALLFIVSAPLLYWVCEAVQGYCVMALSDDGENFIWRYPQHHWFVLCDGNIRLDYVHCWWICGTLEYMARCVVP